MDGWMDGRSVVSPPGCQTDHVDSVYWPWIQAIWCHFRRSPNTHTMSRLGFKIGGSMNVLSNLWSALLKYVLQRKMHSGTRLKGLVKKAQRVNYFSRYLDQLGQIVEQMDGPTENPKLSKCWGQKVKPPEWQVFPSTPLLRDQTARCFCP